MYCYCICTVYNDFHKWCRHVSEFGCSFTLDVDEFKGTLCFRVMFMGLVALAQQFFLSIKYQCQVRPLDCGKSLLILVLIVMLTVRLLPGLMIVLSLLARTFTMSMSFRACCINPYV
jgi:hypothetical protein